MLKKNQTTMQDPSSASRDLSLLRFSLNSPDPIGKDLGSLVFEAVVEISGISLASELCAENLTDVQPVISTSSGDVLIVGLVESDSVAV